MLCSIIQRIETDPPTFLVVAQIADGTLAGGVALSNLRINVERLHDIVIPLEPTSTVIAQAPVLFNRNIRRFTVDFTVNRCHATARLAEKFIWDGSFEVPTISSAVYTYFIRLTSQDGATIADMPGAKFFRQNLVSQVGAMTIHSYHIEGGPFAISTTPLPEDNFIISETGDHIITEDEQKIKVE